MFLKPFDVKNCSASSKLSTFILIVFTDIVYIPLKKITKATEAYAATAAQGLPLLCIWGEEDRTMPIYQAQRMQEVCPQVQLVRFSGSGHIFVYDEGDRTMDVVLPFLKGIA